MLKSRQKESRYGFFGLTCESDNFLRLDILRFIASMGIVIYHFSQSLGLDVNITEGLHLLVDAFFVISGIVICHVYIYSVSTPRQIKKFIVARIARLGPLHWATTLIYVVLSSVAVSIGVELANPEKYDPACLPAVIVFAHSAIGCDKLVYNFVSWSVSAEFIMYLIFPGLSIIFFRARWSLPVLCLSTLLLLYVYGGDWWDRTYDLGFLRAFPGFVFGMILFAWRNVIKLAPISHKLFLPAVAVMIASMCFWPGPQGFIIPVVYSCVALVYVIDLRGQKSPALEKYASLGKLTYSLYMLHPLIQTILLNFVGEKVFGLHGWSDIVYTWIIVALSIPISVVSLNYFETPARSLVKRLLASNRQPECT